MPTMRIDLARYVLLAAACAFEGSRIDAQGSEPFHMRVQLHIEQSIAPDVLTADLEEETGRLWAPYGVDIQWTDDRSVQSTFGAPALRAIVARRIEEPFLSNASETILGRAVVSLRGPIAQPVRVSFEATEKVMSMRRAIDPPVARIVREQELTRALARVLAHEIGHVLLAVSHHDERGLMRAAFRSDELAATDRAPFRLTCSGVGRLRSRVLLLGGIEQQPIDHAACIPAATGDTRTAP